MKNNVEILSPQKQSAPNERQQGALLPVLF